jgi:Winged helix-turn helix
MKRWRANASAACRAMGVDRPTYYRWKRKVDRWGLEALRVRERRRPRMPNEIGPHLEQRIVAFSLGQPGYGPRRISAGLRREKWGGIRVYEHGVWRVHLPGRAEHARNAPGLDRPPPRSLRAQARDRHPSAHRRPAAGRQGPARLLLRRAAVRHQGHRLAVHSDRRRVRLRLGELRTSHRNPRATRTREPLHRVARDLKAAGWKLREVGTDNGSEFRSREFGQAVEALGSQAPRPAQPAADGIRRARHPLSPGSPFDWFGDPETELRSRRPQDPQVPGPSTFNRLTTSKDGCCNNLELVRSKERSVAK